MQDFATGLLGRINMEVGLCTENIANALLKQSAHLRKMGDLAKLGRIGTGR